MSPNNQMEFQRSVIREEVYESMSEAALLRRAEQGDQDAELEIRRRRRMDWAKDRV